MQFVPHELAKINQAAKSLCEWVHAVNNFTDIFTDIQAKRGKSREMDSMLKQERLKLKISQQQLDEVNEKVAMLEKEYQSSRHEKDQLDTRVKEAEIRLKRAEQLNQGLADEEVRWKEKLTQLEQAQRDLFGDGFVLYGDLYFLGPYPMNYRLKIINQWKQSMERIGISFNPKTTLQERLTNQKDVSLWQSMGLGEDATSVSNGVHILKNPKNTLIVDPQKQGHRFLTNVYQNATVVQLNASTDLKSIKADIVKVFLQGGVIFINDVEDQVPHQFQQMVMQQYSKKGNVSVFLLDDMQIEVGVEPKIYLFCNIASTSFTVDTFNQVIFSF